MVDNHPDRSDEEQDDETTDGDNSTMSDYNFIQTDDESDDSTDDTSDEWSWDRGDHTTATDDTNALTEVIGETMDELDSDVDSEMLDVLGDAQDLVSDVNVSRFECSHEDCGLGHSSHGPEKHRATYPPDKRGIPGFNVTEAFADQMEFQDNCHCGANEAAMLVQFFPYIDIPMFKDQHQFESVLELEADELQDLISLVVSGEMDPSRAALEVVEARQSAFRDELEMFLGRVQQMQQQANKAPIAQETRAVIEERRKELEELTSQ